MTKIILCADDSKTMQTVAEITFRASEYTYVGAQSADEALQKAHASKPALILADAVMPGKTGYDLCKAVKTDPTLADVPVVLLCGNSSPYDAERADDAGADGYVTKPWDTQVMLDKVDEIVKRAGDSGTVRPAGTAAAPPVVPKPPILPAAMGAKPKVDPNAAATGPQRTHTIMGMGSPMVPVPAPPKGAPGAGSAPQVPSPPSPVDMQSAKPLSPPLGGKKPAAVDTPAAGRPAAGRPAAGRATAGRPATQPGNTPVAAPPAARPGSAPRPPTGGVGRTPARAAAPAGGRPRSRPGVSPAGATPPAGLPTSAPDLPQPAVHNRGRAPAAEPSRGQAAAAPAVADSSAGVRRPPMIRGTPMRRTAPAQRPGAATAGGALGAHIDRAIPAAAAAAARDAGLDPNGPEMKALLAISKDVVERIVWEVVPDLAETIIRENLEQLAKR